jgi:Fe-S-cluster-containing hydrogenase component 2
LTGGYNPRLARLAIRDKRENLYHIPVVCNQCENAYCMNACPTGAITRNKAGIVTIDRQKCTGCGLCAEYCPVNVIVMHPETGKAFKCELCRGNPQCVEACPTKALELVRKDGQSQKGGNQ